MKFHDERMKRKDTIQSFRDEVSAVAESKRRRGFEALFAEIELYVQMLSNTVLLHRLFDSLKHGEMKRKSVKNPTD